MTDFYRSFTEIIAMRPATKKVISADLNNVGHGNPLRKSLSRGYYMTDFNQTFTKIMRLGLATKA